MMYSTETDVKETYPHGTEEAEAIVEILDCCQVINKSVRSLEKMLDGIDKKVTKIYHSRARSFWRYPPFRAVYRKYNYLVSKRRKLQRVRRFIHGNLISCPHTYCTTSLVRKRNEDSEDMEDTQIVDYPGPFEFPNPIDNSKIVLYADYIDNNQPLHYAADDISNTQSLEYADSIDSSIQNTKDNDVFHSEYSQEVILVSSSPERDYQETPPSPTAQTYQQYYRIQDIPSSSTMPDFENTNVDTITSITATAKEAIIIPPGEFIPIQNPEVNPLAFLAAHCLPVVDSNTFDSWSQRDDIVVRNLGNPVSWSVNDVITFLNHLDLQLADQIHPIIREQSIDGKALLFLDVEMMTKYMGMKLGVAMKFDSYIQKLKEGLNCGK